MSRARMELRAKKKARCRMRTQIARAFDVPFKFLGKRQILDVLPWMTEQARLAVERGAQRERDEARWREIVDAADGEAARDLLRGVGLNDIEAQVLVNQVRALDP